MSQYPQNQHTDYQPEPYYHPQQFYQQYQQMPPQFQPPVQPPPKKRRKLPIVLLILAVIVAVIVLVSSLSSKGGDTTTNTSNSTTTATQAATGHTSQPVATWKTTHTFSGNGTKKTETFSVGNDWKILYSCNGIVAGTATDGILGVSVYSPDNTPIDPGAVNATCASGSKLTTGETEEHQAGNVYLSVDGTGQWNIQVQELK